MAIKLIQQVAVIFVLMGIGVFIKKKNIVTYDAARMFSNFVLMLVSPSLIIKTFQLELEKELISAMAVSFLLAVIFHVMAIIVSRFLVPSKGDDRRIVERLLVICSNCGFMGIPIITAVMGEKGTIFAAIYVGVFNVYVWSHGAMITRKTTTIKIREIITAPGTVAVIIGVGLFLLQVRLPTVAYDTLGYVAAMNTPLPTIITGVFIADVSVREALCNKRVYYASLLRLVVLPLLFLAILWAMRVAHWFPGAETVALAAMISCSCSGAVTTIMMPAKFGGDVQYGANLIAVSSLLSIVTIPLIASLSQFVFTL